MLCQNIVYEDKELGFRRPLKHLFHSHQKLPILKQLVEGKVQASGLHEFPLSAPEPVRTSRDQHHLGLGGDLFDLFARLDPIHLQHPEVDEGEGKKVKNSPSRKGKQTTGRLQGSEETPEH